MVQRKKVLAAINDTKLVQDLDPLLSRSSVDFDQVANGEGCVVLASTNAYDLVLAQLPMIDMSAPQLLSSLRSYGSPSRDAQILMLASGSQARAIEALEYKGIDKLELSASAAEFRSSVAAALGVALRTATRVLVNLHVEVEDSRSTRVYETANLSRTGMLVRTAHPLSIGTELEFDLCLSRPDTVLQGIGHVVRHTSLEREAVSGMGIEFSSLGDSGASCLDSFVKHNSLQTA